MGKAVITLSIGLSEAERASHRTFEAYAGRHGFDFLVISEPRFRIRPNWFRKRRVWCQIEKFQVYRYFERYERILFLDSDILIHPSCPDLFEQVSPDKLGCAFDDTGEDAWKREVELRKLCRKLGPLEEGPWRYFNTGVLVMGRAHQSLFTMDRKAFRRGRWPEQTLLNYRAIRDGVPLHELDHRFNFFPAGNNGWDDPAKRLTADIIHYAGTGSKAVMEKDLDKILDEWGPGKA